MYIIGIPTYNESDNIQQLTAAIDAAAKELKIPIEIVNADNSSPDNTANLFLQTKTQSPKKSIVTTKLGKGVNIRAILDYMAMKPEVAGCIFIDGDITSFEHAWLETYKMALEHGADYVVPNYKRNYQEGNTTNHFVYPLLNAMMNGKAPRQPISGDFGISKELAVHLVNKNWSSAALGYGVDIFMTMSALFEGFKVKEIALTKKIHKPSFPKMTGMFLEVATSYYETAQSISGRKPKTAVSLLTNTASNLDDPRISISSDTIAERRKQAYALYKETPSVVDVSLPKDAEVTPELWVTILQLHNTQIGKKSAHEIAASILPWYLLRATNYLKNNTNARTAEQEINIQAQSLRQIGDVQ